MRKIILILFISIISISKSYRVVMRGGPTYYPNRSPYFQERRFPNHIGRPHDFRSVNRRPNRFNSKPQFDQDFDNRHKRRPYKDFNGPYENDFHESYEDIQGPYNEPKRPQNGPYDDYQGPYEDIQEPYREPKRPFQGPYTEPKRPFNDYQDSYQEPKIPQNNFQGPQRPQNSFEGPYNDIKEEYDNFDKPNEDLTPYLNSYDAYEDIPEDFEYDPVTEIPQKGQEEDKDRLAFIPLPPNRLKAHTVLHHNQGPPRFPRFSIRPPKVPKHHHNNHNHHHHSFSHIGRPFDDVPLDRPFRQEHEKGQLLEVDQSVFDKPDEIHHLHETFTHQVEREFVPMLKWDGYSSQFTEMVQSQL